MKARQKTIRVFEVEITNTPSFLAYLQKNAPLLREFLMLIEGELDAEAEEALKRADICYLHKGACQGIRTPHERKEEIAPMSADPAPSAQSVASAQVYHRTIRSGEEITHEGDVVVFGRINSGARVSAGGNLQVFGEVDGILQCDGEFMVLQEVRHGSVIFRGEIVDASQLGGALTRIRMGDGHLHLEPL